MGGEFLRRLEGTVGLDITRFRAQSAAGAVSREYAIVDTSMNIQWRNYFPKICQMIVSESCR